MKFLMRLVVIGSIVLPLSAQAATTADLQAQAAALLQQVQALQAQLAAQQGTQVTSSTGIVPNTTGGANAACPLVGRSLKRGSSGDDVSRLQQFLARDTSVYPEGQVSGYYGALTEAAVKRWQAKFNIVSSGDPGTTGYGVVGPRTAAAIAIVCAGGSINGVSGTAAAAAPVGGYIQVTPISGNAPLSVSVTATINTTNSCVGAIYTLNYGDGTVPQQIQAPPGNCQQLVQTFNHTYLYGGAYQILLSAGSHSTSATVVVYGSGSPGGPGSSVGDKISASPTSGNAPLSVAFSGIINAAQACGGGSYSLQFGDNQSVPLTYNSSSCAAQSYSVTHQYTAGGTYTAYLQTGTGANVGNTVIQVQTLNSNATYGPMSVTPGVNANPSAVQVQFDLPSSCTGYSVVWGDLSPASTQNDGGSSCAQQGVTQTLAHTYTGSGNFTITLKRGPTLSKVDTASVVISQ